MDHENRSLTRFFHRQGHQPGSALTPPNLDDAVPFQPAEGFRTADELAQANESAKGGKSSLMQLADSFSTHVAAAERQHAQSLQEVIDAQDNAINKLQVAMDTAKELYTQAASIATQASKIVEDALQAHINDVADTNRHIKRLKAIRLKPGDTTAVKPSSRLKRKAGR